MRERLENGFYATFCFRWMVNRNGSLLAQTITVFSQVERHFSKGDLVEEKKTSKWYGLAGTPVSQGEAISSSLFLALACKLQKYQSVYKSNVFEYQHRTRMLFVPVSCDLRFSFWVTRTGN
jgi:hypothetical protein